MSVLIKGGRIVTAADDYVGDIYIENGTVSLIGESLDVSADKVIDATGKLVFPGAIDPHTHIELPFGGTVTCDDFTSGTVSAAFGGTTALVDFCFQMPGQTWHARTRPPETEGEATNRAIQLARVAGAPLYVVHVSCKESIEPIEIAREKGWDVWGETCTQYLFVDESALDQPDFEGGKYVYTPPPRPKENQEHLWKALTVDDLSVVSTDHCPFNWPEQKGLGRDDFSKIPNGGPGIENRLHMLDTFGVGAGRFSLNRFVELVSTNPAKAFGLYPRKGTIAPGSDADIVVWDPEKKLTISAKTHHSNVDYNLFEGTEVTGAPEVVLVRGQVIVENDELVAQPGAGRFVQRARFGEELLPAGREAVLA